MPTLDCARHLYASSPVKVLSSPRSLNRLRGEELDAVFVDEASFLSGKDMEKVRQACWPLVAMARLKCRPFVFALIG